MPYKYKRYKKHSFLFYDSYLVYILNTPIKDMILINDCDIIRADKLNEIETVEFPNSTCISNVPMVQTKKNST